MRNMPRPTQSFSTMSCPASNARREEIDALIDGQSGRAMEDGARSTRRCCRYCAAGTYELLARADIPTASVIDEYLDVAHAFFDAKDAKFVNGLLDAVAKAKRG